MNDDFAAAAGAFPDPFRLMVRESAPSTNDELRQLACQGAAEGLVLLALEQTAGRGRRGATWFAAPGESLAFSILLRPSCPKALWPRLALASGLAVAEAIESFGVSAGIKWPNDVWLARRKAAGILVEAGQDFVIVGIGLNVNTTSFPGAVEGIASSLRLAAGRSLPRPDVLAAVIGRFAVRVRQIDGDFPQLIDGVRQRCVLTGQEVSLLTAQGPMQGRVEEISASGELVLRTTAGLHKLLQADEVRLSNPPG